MLLLSTYIFALSLTKPGKWWQLFNIEIRRMAKKQTNELSGILSEADLSAYCPDLPNWPRSWCFDDPDLIPGTQIVEVFKPFLRHMLTLDLTRATRNRHRDNLWLLGGEIIRDINETPKLRKRPADALIRKSIIGGQGPSIYHCTSDAEQRSIDSTCRKLHRFLTEP